MLWTFELASTSDQAALLLSLSAAPSRLFGSIDCLIGLCCLAVKLLGYTKFDGRQKHMLARRVKDFARTHKKRRPVERNDWILCRTLRSLHDLSPEH